MVIGFITTSYRQYFKVPNGEKVDYWTFLFLLFVTKATQYYVHGGLQQIKGSLAMSDHKHDHKRNHKRDHKITSVITSVITKSNPRIPKNHKCDHKE